VIALPPGPSLVVASHNKDKLREIKELLAPFGFDIRGAGELGLSEPEEKREAPPVNPALPRCPTIQGYALARLAAHRAFIRPAGRVPKRIFVWR
jgi:XTP/dITP diphosphohydrolase